MKPHAEPPDEVQAELDRLYPGKLALLLVALCSPTETHEHCGRSCESPGKIPLAGAWNGRAIERWRFGANRETHIARAARYAACGGNLGWVVPPGGLVLDADTPEAVRALEAVLPDAPMQESRPGRAHFVVRVPTESSIKSTVALELATGVKVDLRSAGSAQIVVEPSIHATGAAYCWKRELPEDLAELPELPAEWLARVLEPHTSAGSRASGEKIHEGGRNDYLFRHGCGLRARNRGESEIREELHAENERHCEAPLPSAEVEEIIRNISARYAAGPSREREEPPLEPSDTARRSELPTVQLTDRQLDAVVDDAVSALVAANDPPEWFLRGGAVVSVRRDEEGRPIVAPATETALVEELARDARWFRRARGKEFESGPTRLLAAVVGQRLLRSEGALPPLRGVTESPLMRADGSILDRPGYDPMTRLYFAPSQSLTLGAVPESPSSDQVSAAFKLLDEELFHDFPFAGGADFATALAALMTLLLRELIVGGVPLFLFDAPAPGSGKGLVVDAGSTAATGAPAAKLPEPDGRGDDEWRKRLTALFLEGRAVAVLDNLERPLGSGSLASALTTETWEDRILGATRMMKVANRTVFIATGNNLRLRGDLPRRCVWCRLDAKQPQPWTRDGFRHPDLLGWVREHRGEIVNAVFTLARAWIAAGRPEPSADVPRLGSFEGWRATIGGILRVAGVPGFLANLPQLYEMADEDTPAWAGFLAAWRSLFGAEGVTVAELLERVKANPLGPLAQALPGELADALDKPSAAKRIGRALARKAETRFTLEDGETARLTREQDRSANALRWRVEKQ